MTRSYPNVIFYQFSRVALLQIHFGSGAARIRNDFFRIHIRIRIKVRIRPDPDPQHCPEMHERKRSTDKMHAFVIVFVTQFKLNTECKVELQLQVRYICTVDTGTLVCLTAKKERKMHIPRYRTICNLLLFVVKNS